MTETDPDGPQATHLADQRAAAAADARAQAMAWVRDLAPGEWGTAEMKPPPPWLVAAIHRHNQLVTVGQTYGCPHVRRTDDPIVVNLAAWMPGYLACSPCTQAGIFAVAERTEDHRCDPCGTVVDDICQAVFQARNLVIHYGLCRRCLDAGE